MAALIELQNSFIRALAYDKCADSLLVNISDNGLNVKQRLQIYRNHFLITLTQSLKIIYPATLRLVGENFFTATAHEFIAKILPSHGILQDFGEEFPDFLANFVPAQAINYLSAVAHFEWVCHQTYYAATCSPLDLARFKNISPKDYSMIKFKLHPSHKLLEYSFPVLSIWQMCQQPEVSANTLDSITTGQKILVIRPELTVNMLALSPGEFTLISAFAQGVKFTQACTLALAVEPELQVDLCLHKHLLSKHIVDFSIEGYNSASI